MTAGPMNQPLTRDSLTPERVPRNRRAIPSSPDDLFSKDFSLMPAPSVTTVIGIDPGSQHTGWGVVREENGGFRLVDCGVIHTNVRHSFPERLATIYRELSDVLERTAPQEASIEQIFVSRNIQSALKLGQARGAAIAACAGQRIPVSDYEPTLVKKTLVGTGHAEKTQVAFMVRTLLSIPQASWTLDTSDALGIALCHLMMRRFPV